MTKVCILFLVLFSILSQNTSVEGALYYAVAWLDLYSPIQICSFFIFSYFVCFSVYYDSTCILRLCFSIL